MVAASSRRAAGVTTGPPSLAPPGRATPGTRRRSWGRPSALRRCPGRLPAPWPAIRGSRTTTGPDRGSRRHPFPCGQFPSADAVSVPPQPPVGVERQVPPAHRAVAGGGVDVAQLSECGDEVAVAQRDAQPPRPGGPPPPAAGGVAPPVGGGGQVRSEEHTSELQSRPHLVCRL